MITVTQDLVCFSQIYGTLDNENVEIYASDGKIELSKNVDDGDTYANIYLTIEDLLKLLELAIKSKAKEEVDKELRKK